MQLAAALTGQGQRENSPRAHGFRSQWAANRTAVTCSQALRGGLKPSRDLASRAAHSRHDPGGYFTSQHRDVAGLEKRIKRAVVKQHGKLDLPKSIYAL